MTINQFLFTSKYCNTDAKNNHNQCNEIWEGLNIQAICDCQCHQSEKKQWALSEAVGPEDNAITVNSSSKEGSTDD